MPYDSGSGTYIRRATTVLDETPDGDTVNSAVATKLDTSTDDAVTDLNHHNVNGGHYPATSVNTDSRYLKQSPAGMVSWASGVPIDQAALKDLSNVTAGVTAGINISGNAATANSATSATSATTAESCSGNSSTATDLASGSVLAVAKGGTGATTQSGARTSLGLGTAATKDSVSTSSGAADIGKIAALDGSGKIVPGFLPLFMGIDNLLHVCDEKPSGTTGGSTSSSTWHTRTLNTTRVNNISGASLASNRVTLPAGTYLVMARAPVAYAGYHRLKLYNYTDSADLALGSNQYTPNNTSVYTDATLWRVITLAAQKTIELRHWVATGNGAVDALGTASSQGAEIYAEVMIWKLA